MALWHAQNISYMMNIMTAKFHVNNVCGLGKKLPEICPQLLLHRIWNGVENLQVK